MYRVFLQCIEPAPEGCVQVEIFRNLSAAGAWVKACVKSGKAYGATATKMAWSYAKLVYESPMMEYHYDYKKGRFVCGRDPHQWVRVSARLAS